MTECTSASSCPSPFTLSSSIVEDSWLRLSETISYRCVFVRNSSGIVGRDTSRSLRRSRISLYFLSCCANRSVTTFVRNVLLAFRNAASRSVNRLLRNSTRCCERVIFSSIPTMLSVLKPVVNFLRSREC